MSITKKTEYSVEIQLNALQYNILAVALDHMWEYLDDIRGEKGGPSDEVINERIRELKLMQTKFQF